MTRRDLLEQDKQESDVERQRYALSNAYGALRGREHAESLAAFTLEEAIDAHIERIEGAGSQTHPNQLDRIERVRSDLLAAVSAVRSVSPDKFKDVDSGYAVNTE